MNAQNGFEDVVGRESTIAFFRRTIIGNTVSHAYILQGEAGMGKEFLAKNFAKALLCESNTGTPCMTCPSCKKAKSGNHPDIIMVASEKDGSVGVDDIREKLVDTIDIRPYEGKYKVYIIPKAAGMTVQAQNALLKTLEEPPAYAVILLLADNAGKLLPTITSRCTMINLGPVSEEKIKDFLMQVMHVPEYQAALQARLSQGNPGKARKLAAMDDFYEKVQESLHYLKKSKDASFETRLEFSKKIAEDKKQLSEYLDIFEMWFRDVIYYKATKDMTGVAFNEELNGLSKRASESSYNGIQDILQSIVVARDRLAANVNPELAIRLLLDTIADN